MSNLRENAAMMDALYPFDELSKFIGVEHALHDLNYALKSAARQMRLPVVGAMHVTCSDESEREASEDFQRAFSQDLLPRLKYANRSAFRTANLGGRYEWQSLRIAEDHFALPASEREGKLMVVKISAHVGEASGDGLSPSRGPRKFGMIARYDEPSVCCGAMAALLSGSPLPFATELEEVINSEGVDRLATLRAAPEDLRALYAALVSARLQARTAVIEAQDHQARTPTLYVILPVVTVNKPGKDTEILVGIYLIDRRPKTAGGTGRQTYRGLSDRADGYHAESKHGVMRITEGDAMSVREARDHRKMVLHAAEKVGKLKRDARVEEILSKAQHATEKDGGVNKVLAKGLIVALAELSPVTAAAILFGQGVSGVFHAYKAHRMVRDVGASADARAILKDLHRRIDTLPPEEAHRVLTTLAAAYDSGH